MNEEKIRITSDEVARADVPTSPSTSTPYSVSGQLSPRTGPRGRFPVGGIVIAIVGLIMAVFLICGAFSLFGRQSVEDWEQHEREHLNTEMSSSPQVKTYIEGIHPFVTFTNAAVKSIRVTTVDGSAEAGKNGNNISEMDLVVTYHWEGPVQKNGFTDVHYVFDMQANKLKRAEYLDSNAEVNLDNINWFAVGWSIGALIFGGK